MNPNPTKNYAKAFYFIAFILVVIAVTIYFYSRSDNSSQTFTGQAQEEGEKKDARLNNAPPVPKPAAQTGTVPVKGAPPPASAGSQSAVQTDTSVTSAPSASEADKIKILESLRKSQ